MAVENVNGDVWVVRRYKGRPQTMGWDAEGLPYSDGKWFDMTTEDIINYCYLADSDHLYLPPEDTEQ